MKVTRKAELINLNQVIDVCVDVHKDNLNFFFATNKKEYSDHCANRTNIIEKKLKQYLIIAQEHKYKNLRILCEPTGQYQNKLLRSARRNGCLTCYVNAESVAKFRVVESNDSGKTDTKDPRVIQTLGKLNKTIKHRLLSEKYLMLRKMNVIYDDIDIAATSLRCKLSKLLVELFCDYSFKKDFLYSNSGLALVENYSCNPYRIIAGGFVSFSETMKKSVPRIRNTTLNRLWSDAKTSVLNQLPDGYMKVLEQHLSQLMLDYLQQIERKEELVKQMIVVMESLREEDPKIPPPTPGVISAKNLARLLGETGPLDDFIHWRKLMRYAGLNIRERQSGYYKGLNKISKKGRPLLRKILNHIALPLVKRDGLYGSYYHKKKDVDKMIGNKAMVVVARHLLRKIHGWYKSGEEFNKQRFFNCESQPLKKAA